MISYYIAKYVDDLTRNEPTNVGVIAADGKHFAARFDGEDEHARIDLRRVRNRITGSHAYRAWVHYWRQGLLETRDGDEGTETAIKSLLETPARDFYLEHGGTIILDSDGRSLAETVEQLFGQLVREPDPPAPLSLREKSKEALSVAGAPMEDESRFREGYEVKLVVEGRPMDVEVSYAVMNGEWHFLQEMPFDPGKPRRSRKEAAHCAFLFEHADWRPEQRLILYDSSDLSTENQRLLEMLRGFAPTVDVDKTESAAEKLHESLRLS